MILLDGEVGDDEPRASRPAQPLAERAVGEPEHGVVVPHHQVREAEPLSGPRHEVEVLVRGEALLEGLLIGPGEDRPVGDGLAEGHLQLHQVHVRPFHLLQHPPVYVKRRIAHDDVRHQQDLPRAETALDIGPEIHRPAFRCRNRCQPGSFNASAMVKMSLSPRPDRVIRTVWSRPMLGASRMAPATA